MLPPAVAVATNASGTIRRRATDSVTSATRKPTTSPASHGVHPTNSYSPRITAEIAATDAAASAARGGRNRDDMDAEANPRPGRARRRTSVAHRFPLGIGSGEPRYAAAMASDASDTQSPPAGGVTVHLDDDWPVQVADRIESTVGSIRDRTAVPLDKAAHWMVYGLLASILGLAAAVLLAIGIVRVIDVYLPEEVWAAHAVTGGMFLLIGLFLWSRRRRPSAS